MAKPRVHEIAAEAGIDSKQALRLLGEMGVHVKSPSSTIEPPVARKLRAAIHERNLSANGREVPRPAPPPQTMPRPSTPLTASTASTPRPAERTRDADTRPAVVYSSSTPRSGPSLPLKDALKEKLTPKDTQPEAGTVAALAKELKARPVDLIRLLEARGRTEVRGNSKISEAEERALRHVFRLKLPKANKRTPAPSQRAQQATPKSSRVDARAETRHDAPDTRHFPDLASLPTPSAELPRDPVGRWNAIRRNILLRREANWERFGFSPSERRIWNAAGIPDDKPHIAAMLLRSGIVEASTTSAEVLSMKLPLGGTLRRQALSGNDSVQLKQAILATTGKPISDVDEDLLLLLGWDSKDAPGASRAELRNAIRSISVVPKTLPALTDAIVDYIAGADPRSRARGRLATAARAYLRSGASSELVRGFAHAHAVFLKDENLRQLCNAAVDYDAEASRRHKLPDPAADLFSEAAASRHFMFLDRGVRDAIEMEPDSEPLPPPPHGIAYIRETTSKDKLLAWATGSSGLECVIFTPSDFDEGRSLPTPQRYRVPDPGESAHLLRVVATLRTPPLQTSGAPRRQGGEYQVPTTATSTPQGTMPPVVLHYRCDSTGVVSPHHARRAPDHRWKVRGHSRRQWYPGTKEHKVIWIDSYTSGPAGRPLIEVERVEVL